MKVLNPLYRENKIKHIRKNIIRELALFFPFCWMLMLGIMIAGITKYINTISIIDGNNIDIVLIKNVNINVRFAASLLMEISTSVLATKTRNKSTKNITIHIG